MKLITSKLFAAALLGAGALTAALPAMAGKTLDDIKAKGQVVCGVSTGLAGMRAADSNVKWTGLDVDICKAMAAAVLKDPEKEKYGPLVAQQRCTA